MAAGVAIGLDTVIGAATYYLTRALLARDSVTPLPDRTGASLEGEVEAGE